MSEYLRSGIFLAPFHNLDENPTLALERDLELLQHLDRLNYHEAWIGEHHSGGFEIIGAPELFIAAAAERTRHIRLGTGVLSLPYHNPFILADRMVQLDHMTRGRAMFGVGPGALVHDALKIGIKAADQRRMMNESLDVIVRLLRGETVTEKTGWYDLQDARLQLPCYTQPVMEMAVAASRSPAGALAAGRHGLGMLSIGGTSPEAIKHHSNNWNLYEDQARGNGHSPDRRKWRMVTLFHIAETREQARRNVQHGIHAFRDYFNDVATFPIVPPDVEDPYTFFVETGAGCIGTPDDAIAYIERLLEGSGGFGTILELAHNWADWAETKRHYELMARYVHPHFQRSREWRRDSYAFARDHHAEFVGQASAAVQAEIARQEARKRGTP
ncbi:LLM class flavin-dependent oxidoreductase [Siccirubricoccus phaeus]|uniref:LLM class flavin-dependent oxidoreductase n=1 Tax=Siccirubricoccus phaeus TaxID=2595053 RepID=UPI001A9C44EE|nr:LLM class flavin-dependent oxidoreductase [Siccirubricoccus phaeus]